MSGSKLNNRDRLGVAIVLPTQENENITRSNCRLSKLFDALYNNEVNADLVLYNDDKVREVEQTLQKYTLVLVWINPIHEGRDRSILDAMLKRIVASGVYVSSNPDIIRKMGTKDVLYKTQNLPWGCDVQIYKTFDEFYEKFSTSLSSGPRVLKQYRGNGGNGVWKIIYDESDNSKHSIIVLHAIRGSLAQKMKMDEMYDIMEQYFLGEGHLIDQQYLHRLPEGMTRVYLCKDQVVGFGHQYVTALVDSKNHDRVEPKPRLYYSKDSTQFTNFQRLRKLMENSWINQLLEVLEISKSELPLLWDADFLLGEKDKLGLDTFVLCEINVSSVFPYPEPANKILVEKIKELLSLNS